MARYLRSKAAAEALHEALERYAALLETSGDAPAARAEVSRSLPVELRAVFALAVALPAAADVVPGETFADALEAKLRSEGVAAGGRVLRPRFGLQRLGVRIPLAAAAAIVVVAAFLVPAMHSLPGDPLYALKTASEDARVFLASGPSEAHVRLDLANERFREVEELIARSRLRAVGFGTSAAGIDDGNIDPRIAALIKSTLQDAAHEVAQAAAIIIEQPQHDVAGLDQLVKITQRGQSVAANVAAVVPHQDKPPVLSTLVSLAKIEAQANAARMTIEPVAAPSPCPTIAPTPTATPVAPSASPVVPAPTPTEQPSATPTATPAASPTAAPATTATPSPCGTAKPVDVPAQTPGADDNVSTTPEPTPATPRPTSSPAAQGASTDRGNATGDGPGTMAGATG
jgi:hypothetical protein